MGHQEGPRVFDDLAAGLHVRRGWCRRLRVGNVSSRHALVLQGAALPRLRLGDPRDARGVSPDPQRRRRSGHAQHGRAQAVPANHVRPDVDRHTGDFGNTAAFGILFKG